MYVQISINLTSRFHLAQSSITNFLTTCNWALIFRPFASCTNCYPNLSPPTPSRPLYHRPGMASQSKPDPSMSTTSLRTTPSHRARPVMTDFSEYRLHPVKSESSLRTPTSPHNPTSPPRGRDRMATADSVEMHQIPRRGSSLRFSSPPALVARQPRPHSAMLLRSDSTYGISSIKVVAGEQTLDKQEFRVDETLIRSNSNFFDRGFTRREFLNDEKPETIRLPKTSAKVFQVG